MPCNQPGPPTLIANMVLRQWTSGVHGHQTQSNTHSGRNSDIIDKDLDTIMTTIKQSVNPVQDGDVIIKKNGRKVAVTQENYDEVAGKLEDGDILITENGSHKGAVAMIKSNGDEEVLMDALDIDGGDPLTPETQDDVSVTKMSKSEYRGFWKNLLGGMPEKQQNTFEAVMDRETNTAYADKENATTEAPKPENNRSTAAASNSDETNDDLDEWGEGKTFTWDEIKELAAKGTSGGKFATEKEVAAAKWLVANNKKGEISKNTGPEPITLQRLKAAVSLTVAPDESVEEVLDDLGQLGVSLFAEGDAATWAQINEVATKGMTGGKVASSNEVAAAKWLMERNKNGDLAKLTGQEPFTLQKLITAVSMTTEAAKNSDEANDNLSEPGSALFASDDDMVTWDDLVAVASTGMANGKVASPKEIAAAKWVVAHNTKETQFQDSQDKIRSQTEENVISSHTGKGPFTSTELRAAISLTADAATTPDQVIANLAEDGSALSGGDGLTWDTINEAATTGMVNGEVATAKDVAAAKWLMVHKSELSQSTDWVVAHNNAKGDPSDAAGKTFSSVDLSAVVYASKIPPAANLTDATAGLTKTPKALGTTAVNWDNIHEIARTGGLGGTAASDDEIAACKWYVNNLTTAQIQALGPEFTPQVLATAIKGEASVNDTPQGTNPSCVEVMAVQRSCLFLKDGVANWTDIDIVARTGALNGIQASAGEIAAAKYLVALNNKSGGALVQYLAHQPHPPNFNAQELQESAQDTENESSVGHYF